MLQQLNAYMVDWVTEYAYNSNINKMYFGDGCEKNNRIY